MKQSNLACTYTYSWLDATDKLCKNMMLILSLFDSYYCPRSLNYWPKSPSCSLYCPMFGYAVFAYKTGTKRILIYSISFTLLIISLVAIVKQICIRIAKEFSSLANFLSQVTEQFIENIHNIEKVTHFYQNLRDIPSKF